MPAIFAKASPGKFAVARKLTRSGARSDMVGCTAILTLSLSAIGLPPSITVPLSTTVLNHVAVSASAVST